ncbi:MAG: SH3 domain-containing protein [Clostridia bacterium]|nr:SH3 domain-containing protein [Clostridia bacterium]
MKKRSLLLFLLVLTLVFPLVSASAATYYYVSGTSSLKIREKPDATSKVKDSYRADFAVVSYKKYDTNWAYVHFSDGAEGYVMRKYLKASSTSTAYVTKDNSALRSGPATSFGQTATLYQGDKVKVLSSGATWSYVSASAGTGYIKKSLLSDKVVKKSGNAGTPYTAYVKNPSGRTVNVRRGAGKGYAVDGELEPGTEVTVEQVNGSWSRISDPISGWMMNSYLTKTAPAPTNTPDPNATPVPTKDPSAGKVRYITSANGKSVNVRRGPSEKGYAVMISLPVGSEVTLVSTEKGWSKITSTAMLGAGYVKNEFLSSKKPGVTATPKPGETPAPTKAPYNSFSATITNPNGGKVNIRRDAGLGYATVTQLEPGTKITVLDEKGNWYKISFDDGSGYVKKEYVKK